MLRGIDIYSGNEWPLNDHDKQCFKESDFVIVKATQGVWYTNEYFKAQIRGADKAGKLLGCYHYAEGGDPKREAEHFYAVAKSWKGKAVPCLDWEKGSNKSWGDKLWCRKFAKRTRELWGVWPLVYVQASEVHQVAACYPECGLWIAGYPQDRNSWTIPVYRYSSKPWKSYDIWQFTSGGEKMDRNVSPLTRAQWEKLCVGTVIGYTTKAVRYLYPEPKADRKKRIVRIPSGSKLTYLHEKSGNWRKVRFGKRTGWVYRKRGGAVILKALKK